MNVRRAMAKTVLFGVSPGVSPLSDRQAPGAIPAPSRQAGAVTPPAPRSPRKRHAMASPAPGLRVIIKWRDAEGRTRRTAVFPGGPIPPTEV